MYLDKVLNYIKAVFNNIADIYFNIDFFTETIGRFTTKSYFMVAAVFLFVVFIASYYEEDRDNKFKIFMAMFKITMVIALINSFASIYYPLAKSIGENLLIVPKGYLDMLYIAEEQIIFINPISLIFISLILVDVYKGKTWASLAFVYATLEVGLFLFGDLLDVVNRRDINNDFDAYYTIAIYFLQPIIISIIAAIANKMKYSFTVYFSMGLCYLFSEVSRFFMSHEMKDLDYFVYYFTGTITIFKIDIAFILIISLIFLVYDIFIIEDKKFEFKNLSISRVLIVAIISVLSFGGMAYAGNKVYSQIPYEVMNPDSYVKEVEVVPEYDYYAAEIYEALTDSYITYDGIAYSPDLMIDGNIETNWQDGVNFSNIGDDVYGNDGDKHITMTFEEGLMSAMSIANGFQSNEEYYYANYRAKEIGVHFYQYGNEVAYQIFYLDDICNNGYQTLDLYEYVYCDQITIDILDYYEGAYYTDLCIAEIGIQMANQIN